MDDTTAVHGLAHALRANAADLEADLAWFTRVLVAGCDPDGALAIAVHRTVVEASDVRTLREPSGRLVVAAYDGGAEELHAVIAAQGFRASQATTTEALRMFAACLDLAEARGRDVGWPIVAGVVTADRVEMTWHRRGP